MMSRDTAQLCAEVLSGNGLKVILPDMPLPTPVFSFEIIHGRASASLNGTASHNPPQDMGLKYNPSITMILTKAQLRDDKIGEKIVEQNKGKTDYTRTGVLVTATPFKSRFTRPVKVKFQIPFFKAPNPYVGLEQYLTWENSGVMEG